MPGFEVWQAPGGMIWQGMDQEEAFLVALKHRQPGVVIEVAEIFNKFGELRPRRLAWYDGRQPTEATE
jgi:hypothetical protein